MRIIRMKDERVLHDTELSQLRDMASTFKKIELRS